MASIVEHDLKSYDRNDSVALDNLILYLTFDESNGSYAYDSSGNGHHGRLIDQATWTEGKSGGAISFDGSNDGMAFEKWLTWTVPNPLPYLSGLNATLIFQGIPQIMT